MHARFRHILVVEANIWHNTNITTFFLFRTNMFGSIKVYGIGSQSPHCIAELLFAWHTHIHRHIFIAIISSITDMCTDIHHSPSASSMARQRFLLAHSHTSTCNHIQFFGFSLHHTPILYTTFEFMPESVSVCDFVYKCVYVYGHILCI